MYLKCLTLCPWLPTLATLGPLDLNGKSPAVVPVSSARQPDRFLLTVLLVTVPGMKLKLAVEILIY